MAGFGLGGDTFTFSSTVVAHMTGWNVTPSASAITQEVADQDAALTISAAPSVTVAVNFALKTTGAATQLAAMKEGLQGLVTLVTKDSNGGSTIATWTASDSLCISQGPVVTGSAGAFTLGTCNFTTNGGDWT